MDITIAGLEFTAIFLVVRPASYISSYPMVLDRPWLLQEAMEIGGEEVQSIVGRGDIPLEEAMSEVNMSPREGAKGALHRFTTREASGLWKMN